MKSPITGKVMQLEREKSKLQFRKEEFPVVYHYYLCKDSSEKFTTEDLDRINETQVHNHYRVKYGVPFPDEIREIREKYGVSASKMSEILGFGANSYRLYEAGEIPSVANGRLILAIKHPKNFIEQVKASSHLLSDKERIQIINNTEKVIENYRSNKWDFSFQRHIFGNETPNEYSGYRKPNLKRISNIICFFSERMDLYKTKLNKLLFYTDFGCFQKTGYSMTGITYKAIPFGPVPSEYDMLFAKLEDDGFIKKKTKAIDDNYAEIFNGVEEFDGTLFDKDEIRIIEGVAEKFQFLTTKQVVNLSHDEDAWKENQEERDLISYQEYGFKLKHINFIEE